GWIQNSSALLASNDFFAAFHAHGGLRGDFHVAAHADLVFERRDGGAPFVCKEPLVAVEQILVHLLRERFALGIELLELRFDGSDFPIEITELALNLAL